MKDISFQKQQQRDWQNSQFQARQQQVQRIQ